MHSADAAMPITGATSAHDGLAELERLAPGSLPAAFREPERQGVASAWWSHVPFAHWLMRVARPGLVVELGTRSGVSYAAFCSSVRVEGLACRCVAVDGRRGDHQARPQEAEADEDLKAWHDAQHAAFSRLMRCSFEEAAATIPDGGVDLLHIDGLHAGAAARHDVEAWLPKLSPRGIVLLHGTEERSGDAGLHRPWSELRERHPSFGFRHGRGLGVLVVGAEAPAAIRALCEPARLAPVEALFAFLGRRWAAEAELAHGRVAQAAEAAAREREAARAVAAARQQAEREHRAAQAARLEAQRARIEAALASEAAEAVTASSFWRATAPLRALLTRMPALRRAARAGFLAARATWRALNRARGSIRLQMARHLPFGGAPDRPAARSRARKMLDLAGVVVRRPTVGLSVAQDSRRLGLRRAAFLAWETHAAPRRAGASGYGPRRRGPDRDSWAAEVLRVVPYYLDPHLRQDPPIPPLRIAVHLHLYYEDMTGQCIEYLRHIPARFDLYVSVPEGRATAALERCLAEALPAVGQVRVEQVPNRGRDVAPLIVQFGRRLLDYDVIAHFHTKKSPHNEDLSAWFDGLMGAICGSASSVAQILGLFARDAKVVYPAGNQIRGWDATGWSDNLPVASRLLKTQGLAWKGDHSRTEFPQGMMFWATSRSLRRFLQLRLAYEDFPEEPIPPDGTLAHALERLLLLLGHDEPGRNYRIETPVLSREPAEWFESQQDFSGGIVHDTVKVLAYYLPQFYPTPENSAWHGEGFTEWHKVRGAHPLFLDHYQQHVPHPDIGYYHLDSPDRLRAQAEMMRKAGVHGMVFYHYWFSGRLILEKPAQMLLANRDVRMPFCFCWANENWTRRWDGNEREILLEQVYSAADAAAFIRYLIPFFHDERYIRVEGRPVLFVYRPSSIDGTHDYVGIWRRECEAAGLPAPYLVAVLTRGATSPDDHGMDAGAERVLHDWLGPDARDIRAELRPYWPLNGSVLDYREVAEHYMRKAPVRDWTHFRSLVPVWDNTARYGSEAFLLHNFTPEAMQRWIGHLIRDAEERLPPDRRFVIVNAWNEWAEGAHLEPDTRFGYGYLNAIGRALCGRAFEALDDVPMEDGLVLRLDLAPDAAARLRAEPEALRRFAHCIAASTVLGRCRLLLQDAALADELRSLGLSSNADDVAEACLTLQFSDLYLFPATTPERMLRMAVRHPGHAICASPRNDPTFLHDPEAPNWQIPHAARTGMMLQPPEPIGYKICAQAPCFRLGAGIAAVAARVSTVIRYHGRGRRDMLVHALFSLLAQGGCNVRPCIGVQDLDEPGLAALRQAVEALPWAEDCQPLLRVFRSTPDAPDLRSEMLNQMLRAAGPDRVAFLDYDDIMFPDAYATLLRRLRETRKNATFARVYSTTMDPERDLILRRDAVFTYGRSYDDFLTMNHAPIHSFMLDMSKVDVDSIEHFKDMKFMEDYYLTLQVFSAHETDWESLNRVIFIGDYVHMKGDGVNTLAITDVEQRRELLASMEYRLSETRIAQLKRRLAQTSVH